MTTLQGDRGNSNLILLKPKMSQLAKSYQHNSFIITTVNYFETTLFSVKKKFKFESPTLGLYTLFAKNYRKYENCSSMNESSQ